MEKMETISLQESQFQRIICNIKNTDIILDENVTLLCSRLSSELIETKSTEWILVSTKTEVENFFYRQVVADCDITCNHCLILTNTNLFNLNVCSPSEVKPALNCDLLIRSAFQFEPKFATEMKIAMIDSYHKVDYSIVDDCLKNYFMKSRYLHIGDLICVNVCQILPDAAYNDARNVDDFLYFKVEDLKGCPYPTYEPGVNYGYYVSVKCTTLHQVNTTQCFVPMCDKTIPHDFELSNFKDEICSLIPDGMNSIYNELEDLTLPFLLMKKEDVKLFPVFLFSGKSGSGKSTLLKVLAKKQGIHYWSENCISIQNSNPAQTESMMNNIFTKIASLSPCILHFRNVEALCEDESSNKDDRTIDCFIKNIKSFQSSYPVIIFCTSSQESKLVPSLQRVFLQTVKIEKLSHTQRLSLLNWILKKENIETENLDKVVSASSNFVFSDLIQLISRAISIAYRNFICSNQEFIDHKRDILRSDHFFEALNEMNETYADAIGAPDVPNVSWDDIGGLSHLKEEILSSLLKPILRNGLRRSGLLLYGPPGTGKTLLAKAVATECNYNFLSVKGPELLNMYVGQSEKNIREVFSRARESAPCVVFFDELDSLAPRRGQSGGSGSVMDRVVSQLLAEMDGIQKSQNIFILAATNRPDLIDSALLRPGRLDKMLFVGKCKDTESKLAVLKALTRKFKFTSEVKLEEIILLLSDSSELTGADLYGICSNAWLSAARRRIKYSQTSDDTNLENDVSVCSDDLIKAISQFKVEDLNSD
ncbi:peroxisomal ATPase PEX6-like [Planococcus citri]|uniref:peroxisomal ATPase PEX6-like n=1 Tax=Planococcus citri TaxID=170843 RepID=UPI0031F8FFDF